MHVKVSAAKIRMLQRFFVFFKHINVVKSEKNKPDQYETLSSAHPYSVFHTADRLVFKASWAEEGRQSEEESECQG